MKPAGARRRLAENHQVPGRQCPRLAESGPWGFPSRSDQVCRVLGYFISFSGSYWLWVSFLFSLDSQIYR